MRLKNAALELDSRVAETVFGDTSEWTMPFSTNMTCAWLVAENMRDRGYRVKIESVADVWACEFALLDKNIGWARSSESLADAICRTALEAMHANPESPTLSDSSVKETP